MLSSTDDLYSNTILFLIMDTANKTMTISSDYAKIAFFNINPSTLSNMDFIIISIYEVVE